MIIKLILLILGLFIRQGTSIFCSAYCKPNFCTGPNSNQCTDCDYPYTRSGSTCIIDTSSGYELFALQGDTINNLGPTTTCGSYTPYGPFYNSDIVRLDFRNSITVPHYSIRLIAWMFLEDAWTAGEVIRGTLTSTGQVVSQPASTYSTAQLLCGWSTTVDWYLKLDMQFSHTTTSNNDRIQITTTQSTSQPWGIKQIIILVGKCHSACLVCTGPTASVCTLCATGFKLSGTTCNETCMYKYGLSSTNSSLCVACDLYCTVCTGTSTTCSSCQTNGTYQSYLSGTTCTTNCPTFTTENPATHRCIPCTNTNCQSCSFNQSNNCEQCVSPGSYWFNFDCILSCPNGYYPNAPNCTLCDYSCLLCTGSPSPCSQCRLGYYMYVDQCLAVCPAGFFPLDATQMCLDCNVDCVKSSISMYLDPDSRKLTSTITFTRRMDFSTFPIQTFQTVSHNNPSIPLSKFQIIYTVIDEYSYKIELVPIGMMNITDTNFSVTINPKTQEYYSIDRYPFHATVFQQQGWTLWNLLILPQMDKNQQAFIDVFQQINQKINFNFAGQFVQEIKKTGIFALLLPGAQLSSTVILHNSVPAENFYEASRFWASFIYFQVPKWQQGPNYTKYMVSQQVNRLKYKNQTRLRLLQSSSSWMDNWRFYRTGHTYFFIFDTYMIVSLLIVSWLLLLIPKLLYEHLTTTSRSIFYNILHKVHELSLFYLGISVALEWLTLSSKLNSTDSNLNYGYVYGSLAMSIVLSVYILAYEVYVFYQLIPFCGVQIRALKYANYVEKFSYFLRDLRFQPYKSDKIFMEWSPRHMLRPYNYQILSCLRMILLVITPCIFHSYPLVCIACMMSLQILEVFRLVLTWPYNSIWRNVIKLLIQIFLLLIFVFWMMTYTIIEFLYSNLNTATDGTVRVYYVIGWVGFALVFVYNVGFVVYQVVDVVMGCRYTNRQRMDASRNEYYRQLLAQFQNKNMKKLQKNKNSYQQLKTHQKQQYEKSYRRIQRQLVDQKDKHYQQKDNEDISDKMKGKKGKFINFLQTIHGVDDSDIDIDDEDPKKVIVDLISKGNLNNKNQDNLKTISVLIQQYQIKHSFQEDKYMVKIIKVPGVFMRHKITPKLQDNTLVPKRNSKQILLHNKLNFQYYRIIHNIFNIFASVSTETVKIRTYLIVDQNRYVPTQEIPQIRENLKQTIQIMDYNGNTEKERLQDLLQGFPIPNQLVEKL